MSEAAGAEEAAAVDAAEGDGTEIAQVTTEGAEPTWRDSLPEDLRENPTLQRYNDVESLSRAAIEARNLISKKGAIYPGDDASPEALNDYYTQIGRPETVEGYELDKIEIPEVLQPSWNADGVSAVVEEMFAKGASKEVVQTAVAKMAEVQAANLAEGNATMQQHQEAAIGALKEKWGLGYPGKLEAAQMAFRELTEEAGVDRSRLESLVGPDGGRLADYPELLELFAHIGEANGEHGFVGEKSRRSSMTPEEAHQKVLELEADPAWTNSDDPRHAIVVQQHLDALAHIHTDEDAA